MAGRKIQVPFPTPESPLVDAYEVDIMESTERWTEVHLEDGSILRFKPSILSALRINGEYDPEGNPVYVLKAGPMTATVSSPDGLRKTTLPQKGQ
ncbi:MAG TPA: hypothetical protein VFC39_03260 [Acidobacteriaceae bacterium]|nr:hypothetical protein [Acidobacteriaceae bacterium]